MNDIANEILALAYEKIFPKIYGFIDFFFRSTQEYFT